MPSLNLEFMPYGENAVALVRHLPPDLPTTTTAKIKVDDLHGNALTAEDTAAIYTAATTDGAITRLANTCTLAGTPTAPTVGLTYRVQKTGEQYDDMIVRAYDSSGKAVTFYNRFKYNHATGAAFTGRYATYTLDISTTATYTDNLECLISWYGFTGDDRVLTNIVRVRKHWAEFGDLREVFRNNFARYDELVPEGGWNPLVASARRRWRRILGKHGVSFDFIVDTNLESATDAMMTAIALQLAKGFGDAWAAEREMLKEDMAELFDDLRRQNIWSDEDDDSIRDEAEFQRFDRPYPRRRI